MFLRQNKDLKNTHKNWEFSPKIKAIELKIEDASGKLKNGLVSHTRIHQISLSLDEMIACVEMNLSPPAPIYPSEPSIFPVVPFSLVSG